MKIETKYSIGDKVLITDLENCKATVLAICIDGYGTSYRVAWFHDGNRKSDWLHESEVTKFLG